MLEFMRRNANSWLMILLFAVIIFVFAINFGPWAGEKSGELPFAAEVNGRVITMNEFRFLYSNKMRQIKRFKPEYTQEQADQDGLKGLVVDQLVSQELLSQLALENDLVIPDKELAKIIKSRFFSENSPFNKENYSRLINSAFQTTESQFENQLRKELLAGQIAELLATGSNISSHELWQIFERRNSKVSLDFVKINPKYFSAKKKYSETEAAKFKTKNKEEIKTYYHNNIAQYKAPKKIKARHILVKVKPDADNKTKEKALVKIKKAQARIKKESFASVAQKISEGPSAKKGGNLGYFGVGAMVKPFSEAAFALKKGEVSEVVETPFGYHLIKVEDFKKPISREFEAVKEEITAILMGQQEQQIKAKKYAQRILKKLKGKTALKDLRLLGSNSKAQGKNLEPKSGSTSKFTKDTRYVPQIGVSPKIIKAAFALTLKKSIAEEVIEVSKNLFVIKLKDREYATKKTFEKESEKLKLMLENQRKQKFMQEYMAYLKEGAKIEYNPVLKK